MDFVALGKSTGIIMSIKIKSGLSWLALFNTGFAVTRQNRKVAGCLYSWGPIDRAYPSIFYDQNFHYPSRFPNLTTSLKQSGAGTKRIFMEFHASSPWLTREQPLCPHSGSNRQ